MANLLRFLKKCLTDPPAALRSSKLVGRSLYGRWYWHRHPDTPLRYRLPTGGVLYLEPGHSFTTCFWPDVDGYEPDVRGVLTSLLKPGSVFIDCGANIGYFSILAAGMVGPSGQVIAIEANPIAYQRLERNLQANRIGTAVHCALAAQGGEVQLFMSVKGDVYSSLHTGGLVTGDSIQSFKVAACTLEEVARKCALSRVDLVKIDVEGAELEVLKSSPGFLTSFKPVIVLEYSTLTWPIFGSTPEALKELSRAYRYALRQYDVRQRKLVAVSEEVWRSPYANLVLVPEETGEHGP